MTRVGPRTVINHADRPAVAVEAREGYVNLHTFGWPRSLTVEEARQAADALNQAADVADEMSAQLRAQGAPPPTEAAAQ